MVEIMILSPIIILGIGLIIGTAAGLISGTLQLIRDCRSRFKPDPAPVIMQVGDKQYIPCTIDVPEIIFEQLATLEFSAENNRREADIYRQQSAITVDSLKQIKLQKKQAAALKRMYADVSKIETIKDKYCIL